MLDPAHQRIKILWPFFSKEHCIANGADPANIIGDYELLTGRAYGALDPKDLLNKLITDIEFAPVNADGMVEYDTKFTLAKPVDIDKASGLLWYDIINRSTGSATPNAHVQLLSGWQGDIAPSDNNYTINVPVARNADGSAITGKVLARIVDPKPDTNTMPLAILGRAIPYDAASLDTAQASLIKKVRKNGQANSGQSKRFLQLTGLCRLLKDAFPGCCRSAQTLRERRL